jgi:hypothetical protein
VGAPEQVREELERMASALQIEEVMIIAVLHDYHARLRSYRLVAEACNLSLRAVNNASGICP